jgi:hypothetical protein
METQSQLEQAAELIEKGDRVEARTLLNSLTVTDPKNEQAWLMLFSALDNPQEKYDCLKQAARINPKDQATRRKLQKYRASSEYRDGKAEYHKEVALEQNKSKKARKRKERFKGCLSFLGYVISDIINYIMRPRYGRF